MWWIIIIGIVVFIAVKFFSDNNKQANEVAKQGGMRKKYSTLVSYFLAGHQNSRIIQEESTFMRIGSVSPGGSTFFDIAQTFGNVTIQWIAKSAFMGNHKLEWTFNEFMDQEEMIQRIEHDVEVYMSNVLNKYK